MPAIRQFLEDTRGAVTIEFTVLVPFFLFLMMLFADASVVYQTHSEMYNAARDIARRMSTGELTTPQQVRDYAAQHLFLGDRQYVVDPHFGSNMTLTITVGFDQAVFFGLFFRPLLGKTIVATSTMRREPRI